MVARSLSRFSLSSTRVSGWRDGGCPCLAACGWKERRGERLAVRLRGSEPLLQVRARVPAGRGGLGGQALPRDGAVGAHALARRARRDGRPGGGGWIVGPLAARGDRLCRGQHAALLRHRARGAAGAGTPLVMICLPPQSTPPHTHSSRHGPQHTQHTASTAATPHYPQGRGQTPADAPTPLKQSMLTPFGGPRPRFGAKARERWLLRIPKGWGAIRHSRGILVRRGNNYDGMYSAISSSSSSSRSSSSSSNRCSQ